VRILDQNRIEVDVAMPPLSQAKIEKPKEILLMEGNQIINFAREVEIG